MTDKKQEDWPPTLAEQREAADPKVPRIEKGPEGDLYEFELDLGGGKAMLVVAKPPIMGEAWSAPHAGKIAVVDDGETLIGFWAGDPKSLAFLAGVFERWDRSAREALEADLWTETTTEEEW